MKSWADARLINGASSNLSFTAKFRKRTHLIFVGKIGGLWFWPPKNGCMGQMRYAGAEMDLRDLVVGYPD